MLIGLAPAILSVCSPKNADVTDATDTSKFAARFICLNPPHLLHARSLEHQGNLKT